MESTLDPAEIAANCAQHLKVNGAKLAQRMLKTEQQCLSDEAPAILVGSLLVDHQTTIEYTALTTAETIVGRFTHSDIEEYFLPLLQDTITRLHSKHSSREDWPVVGEGRATIHGAFLASSLIHAPEEGSSLITLYWLLFSIMQAAWASVIAKTAYQPEPPVSLPAFFIPQFDRSLIFVH